MVISTGGKAIYEIIMNILGLRNQFSAILEHLSFVFIHFLLTYIAGLLLKLKKETESSILNNLEKVYSCDIWTLFLVVATKGQLSLT